MSNTSIISDVTDLSNFKKDISMIYTKGYILTEKNLESLKKLKLKRRSVSDYLSIIKCLEKSTEDSSDAYFTNEIQNRNFQKNNKTKILFVLYSICAMLLSSYNLHLYNPNRIIFRLVNSFDTEVSKSALELLNFRYSDFPSLSDKNYVANNFNLDLFFTEVKFSYFKYLTDKNYITSLEIPEEYKNMKKHINTELNLDTYFDTYVPYIIKLDKEKAMKVILFCKIQVFLNDKKNFISSLLYGISLALKILPNKFKPSNDAYYTVDVYSLTEIIQTYYKEDTLIRDLSIQILEFFFMSQFFVSENKICLRIYDKELLDFVNKKSSNSLTEKIIFVFNFIKESDNGKMKFVNFITKMQNSSEEKQTKENFLNLIFSIFKFHEFQFQGEDNLFKEIIVLFYNEFNFHNHALKTPILDVHNQQYNSLFNTIHIIFKNISFDEAYKLEIINFLKIFYKNNIRFFNDTVKFSFIELFKFLDNQNLNDIAIYQEFTTFFNEYFVIRKQYLLKHYEIFTKCILELRNVPEIYVKCIHIMFDVFTCTDFPFIILWEKYSEIFNSEILWIFKNYFNQDIWCLTIKKLIEIALVNERKYFIYNQRSLNYYGIKKKYFSSVNSIFTESERLIFHEFNSKFSTFYEFLYSNYINFIDDKAVKIDSIYMDIFDLMSSYFSFDKKINIRVLEAIDSHISNKYNNYLILESIFLEIERKIILFEKIHNQKTFSCTFDVDAIEIFCRILRFTDFFEILNKDGNLFTKERCKIYLGFFKTYLKFISRFYRKHDYLRKPKNPPTEQKPGNSNLEDEEYKQSIFEKSHELSYLRTLDFIRKFKSYPIESGSKSSENLVFEEISSMLSDSDFYICDIMSLVLEYLKCTDINFIKDQLIIFFNNLFSVLKKDISNFKDKNDDLEKATEYILKIYRNYINEKYFSDKIKDEISYKIVLYFAKYFDKTSIHTFLVLSKFLKKYKYYSSLQGFKDFLPDSFFLKSFFNNTLNTRIYACIDYLVGYKDEDELQFNFYYDLFHVNCFYFISKAQYKSKIVFLMIYQIIFLTEFDPQLFDCEGFFDMIATNLLIISCQKYLMNVEKVILNSFIKTISNKQISNINDKNNVSYDDYCDFYISILCISERYKLFTKEEIFSQINFNNLISIIGDENISNDFFKKVFILLNFFIFDNEFNKKYFLFLLYSSKDDSYKEMLFKRCFMNINNKGESKKFSKFCDYLDLSGNINMEDKKYIVRLLFYKALESKNMNILLYLTRMFHLMPNLVRFIPKKYILNHFFTFILQQSEINILTNLNQFEWHLNYYGELFLTRIIYCQDRCLQYQIVEIILVILQNLIDSIMNNRGDISFEEIKNEVCSKISFELPCKKTSENKKIEPLDVKKECKRDVPIEIKDLNEKKFDGITKNNILIILKLIYKILKSKPCCCKMCLKIFKMDENSLKKQLANLFIENGILGILQNIFFMKNTDFDLTEKYNKYSSFIVNEMLIILYQVKKFSSRTVFHSYFPHFFGDLFEDIPCLPAYLKKTDLTYIFCNLISGVETKKLDFKTYLDFVFDFNLELDSFSKENPKSSKNPYNSFKYYKSRFKITKLNFTVEKKIDYKNLLSHFFINFLDPNEVSLTKDIINEKKLRKNNRKLHNDNPSFIIESLYWFLKCNTNLEIKYFMFYHSNKETLINYKEELFKTIKKRNIDQSVRNHLEGFNYGLEDNKNTKSPNSLSINPKINCSSNESLKNIADQISSSSSYETAESSLSNEKVETDLDANIDAYPCMDFKCFNRKYFQENKNENEMTRVQDKLIFYFMNFEKDIFKCNCKNGECIYQNTVSSDMVLDYSFLFACGYCLNTALGKVSFLNFINFVFEEKDFYLKKKNTKDIGEIIESVRERYSEFKLPEINRKISILTYVFMVYNFLHFDSLSLQVIRFYLYDNFHFDNSFSKISYLSDYSEDFNIRKQILKMSKSADKSIISQKVDSNCNLLLFKKKPYLYLEEKEFELFIYFKYKYCKNISVYLDCLCKIICYKMDILFNEFLINKFDMKIFSKNEIFIKILDEISKIIGMEYKNIKSYAFNEELIQEILSNNFWPVISFMVSKNCEKAREKEFDTLEALLKFVFFCYDLRKHLNYFTKKMIKFQNAYELIVKRNKNTAIYTLNKSKNNEVSMFYLMQYGWVE
ncbi:hypothetical protein CWI36_0028p0010 [Hamiltosporidium magnivora]|uniref:Uncharacterized protein n=1 Tax=Hamiltosporidium magnivora TaxID=148818 RepID=A0A4Q9LM70_9MICR|nr:hypothetical protein CWI36_0028p0010 [Hamiltosporidium magnivora]